MCVLLLLFQLMMILLSSPINVASLFYNDSFITGCYSSCQAREAIGCYGIKCCQTRIPSSLQVFNASVSPANYYKPKETTDCKKAILVQESWLPGLTGNHTETAYGILSHAERVPVVFGEYAATLRSIGT
ncbi:hypothetical protein ACOSQ3_004165 [Xanthoceras sorbifolium]